MSTYCQIFVKNLNLTQLSEEIKKNFPFGRISHLEFENETHFYDKKNECFILSESSVSNWIVVSYQFLTSIHELDGFLEYISKVYKTKVLFGYEQTTTGDAKFVFYKEGIVKRYIYQEYDLKKEILIQKIDKGDKLATERNFIYPKIGKSLENFHILDFVNDIQNMFIDAGYKGAENKVEKELYIHIERIKTAHNNG